MRLTPYEVQVFIQAIAPFVKDTAATLFLIGSRTQDDLKGGDIDLVLLLSDASSVQNLKVKKHHVLAAVFQHLDEQKIDLFIASEAQIKTDPFLSAVMPKAILLHRFLGTTT